MGKSTKLIAATLSLVLVCSGGLVGCAASSNAEGETKSVAESAASSAASEATSAAIDIEGMDLKYSDRDLDASYDAASATTIELAGSSASVTGAGAVANGATVAVSEPGTYVVSGSLNDGQLVVEAGAEDKVQIVLDGVSIHNEAGPALYVKQADKVFVTLADGTENELSDGAGYDVSADENEPYAALFSCDDLTINGSGSLSVAGCTNDGIASKDDLVITGGTFNVEAVGDALRGRDCVKICDGAFTLMAGEDAVKSSNDEDGTRGFVCIDGGTFSISAGDDAVHAETLMRITDGQVDVTACYEGYEGVWVVIDGGTTSIVSSDDALNAASPTTTDAAMGDAPGAPASPAADGAGGTATDGAGVAPADAAADSAGVPPADSAAGGTSNGAFEQGSEAAQPGGQGMAEGGGAGMSDSDCLVQVNGGRTVLNAEGDGIDSNGSVEVNGGTLFVSGPTNSGNGFFDYDLEATVSGGTVVMTGTSGMAQNFTSGTQAFAMVSASGQAGSEVALTDEAGNEVASLVAAKRFDTVLVSAPGFAEGSTAALSVDGASTQVPLSTTAAVGMGGMGSDGRAMGPGAGGEPQRGGRR